MHTRYKVKTAFRQKQGDTVGKQMILEHTFKNHGYQQNIDSAQLGSCKRAELYGGCWQLLNQTAKTNVKPSSKTKAHHEKAKLQQTCYSVHGRRLPSARVWPRPD